MILGDTRYVFRIWKYILWMSHSHPFCPHCGLRMWVDLTGRELTIKIIHFTIQKMLNLFTYIPVQQTIPLLYLDYISGRGGRGWERNSATLLRFWLIQPVSNKFFYPGPDWLHGQSLHLMEIKEDERNFIEGIMNTSNKCNRK